MLSRRSVVLTAVASAAVVALPAPSALGMTRHQRAVARTKLLREVKRNPAVISRRSFVRRASLVDFKLPVTIRLRTGSDPATTNVNRATIDLGASLGRREVELDGSLAAEIQFHDTYDGGALGNVDVDILSSPESSPFALRSTSVPLLWNESTKAGSYAPGAPAMGCGDFTGGGNVGTPYFGTPPWSGAGYSATAGAPVFSPSGAAAYSAFLAGTGPLPPASSALDSSTPYTPAVPGVDGLDRLAASKAPGNDAVGGNTTPFPYGAASTPGGFTQPPDIRDTVLRTNSLRLQIAQPGTLVDWAHPPDGHGQGSGNYVIPKSGGRANLFGNIPGKPFGIDVVVSLATKISSLMRVVDPDQQLTVAGSPWPGASLSCRQLWTGWVQNYLIGITLGGSLKISPGITSDGRLRIAKATLHGASPYRTPLAACLQPYAPYASAANDSDNSAVTAPTAPLDPTTARPAPDVPCNTQPNKLLRDMNMGVLGPAQVANGYDVDWTGAQVTVGGDISVDSISADVLIGG